ncbi:MAG: hypothetical protein QXK89_10765 [Candidatus Bathyarchaeia archaeon]
MGEMVLHKAERLSHRTIVKDGYTLSHKSAYRYVQRNKVGGVKTSR